MEVLARLQLVVEQGPQLRALRLGLPLTKTIAVAEDALFGARFFFVATSAADQRVKAELLDGLQQRDRLVHVAALAGVGQAHRAALHRIFDAAHDELGTQLAGTLVAKVGHFGEVVTGVDHQQRVRQLPGAKGFFGALEHDQGVLAARKQQGGSFKRGRHFAQDEDGFLFQRVEVAVAQGGEFGVCTGVHDGVLKV